MVVIHGDGDHGEQGVEDYCSGDHDGDHDGDHGGDHDGDHDGDHSGDHSGDHGGDVTIYNHSRSSVASLLG